MKFFSFIVILFFLVPVYAQEFFPWLNIRNSAYTLNNDIHIRSEIMDLNNLQTDLFYSQGNGWFIAELTNLEAITYEAVIPVLPELPVSCRFRTIVDNDFFDIPDLIPNLPETVTLMMPGYLPQNPFPPAVADLAYIADDPAGDVEPGVPADLDLTGSYFSYSDLRLYSGLTNVTGAFPTGPIFGPFNIYATMLINPENISGDIVIYAMIYANVPLLLTSGLYRISNLENPGIDSFQQIGSINHQVIENTLVKACNIADLVNDPYFGDWPNFSNSLVTLPVTIRASLTPELELDIVFGDAGQPAVLFFEQYIIESFDNNLPILSGLEVYPGAATVTINITYFDEDGNFPLVSELALNEDEIYDFVPLGYNFQEPVFFTLTLPLMNLEGTIRFSDNGYEYVELPLSVSAEETSIASVSLPVRIYPNPYFASHGNNTLNIEFTNNKLRKFSQYDVGIYDIKGRLVRSFDANNNLEGIIDVSWDGFDSLGNPVSSGIYLVRVREIGSNSSSVRKLMFYR